MVVRPSTVSEKWESKGSWVLSSSCCRSLTGEHPGRLCQTWALALALAPLSSHSPGRHPEVFLDEVAGDGQGQQGDEEDGGHVADDPQGRNTQQGGAGEALQGGGDVLVDGVDVRGEPVEDASEGSGLEQPGGKRRKG